MADAIKKVQAIRNGAAIKIKPIFEQTRSINKVITLVKMQMIIF